MPLELSHFGTIPVVTFWNESLQQRSVHVFRTAAAAREAAKELELMPNIREVVACDATVK